MKLKIRICLIVPSYDTIQPQDEYASVIPNNISGTLLRKFLSIVPICIYAIFILFF